jgi:hypothetical protein
MAVRGPPTPPSSDEKSTAEPSPGHCELIIVRVISRKVVHLPITRPGLRD